MALTEIQYGSLASSETMNNNFNYLDDRISTVASTITSAAASLNSNIATINSSILTLSGALTENTENLQSSIDNLGSVISSSGLYIEQYINGTSWYREYFSDSSKTQRVWLEQGMLTPTVAWGDNSQKTYTFLKSFSNTSYTAIAVSTSVYVYSGVTRGDISVVSLAADSLTLQLACANTCGVRIYACGV